ncbi:MAG: T9SS type A sorting domain-containing protein [bacterium]|nr:T9SS type A sorting domain-containing protein [bacterium]
MKRNLLAVLAIASSSLAFSQVGRTPMIEHFTQASCGPCASQNPAMKTTLDNYANGGGEYVKVSHQVSWPGTDPMNAAYPAGPDVRRNYYGVSGVPNTTLNGGSPGAPNTIVTASTLAAAAQETTPYDITVTQSWQDANTVDVNIDVTNTTGSAVSDADRIYVALYEDVVDYGTAPGSNGETIFYNVLRQMYTTTGSTSNAEAGSALPTIAGNATESYSFTISNLPSYLFDKAQVRFAVYIQNDATKDVHQAAKSVYSPIPGIVNVAAASASTAGAGLCDYAFTPAVEFTNNDQGTDITSIVAEYSIDGGTPVQETWTGTLTGGNSTTITFPATTLNPGTSTVSYSIVSANGGQPWSSPNAVAIPDEIYNKLNANGVAAPVMETMENAPLETGTGYSRDLSTAIFDADASLTSAVFGVLDGPSYNYGSIGGYGQSDRSIRVRFYSIQSGTMNLTMQKINMPANNATLAFDHTYKQYTSENDQLTVYVSTDCGATWNQEFQAAGSALATLPASTTQYNAPAAGDWTTNTVDLSAYNGMSDVVVRFEFVSAYGNNLFLDNINVDELSSVSEETAVAFAIYPNPATDNFTVKLDESSDVAISVIDVQGKVVATQNAAGQSETVVDASTLAPGIYTVLVSSENGVATKKVVVE